MEPAGNDISAKFTGHFWAFLILVALANFAGAVICDWLSVGLGPVAGFWLPGGISLAVVLRFEPRRWPLLIIACGVGTFAFDLILNKPLPVCLGFAAADCVETLSGAWLARRMLGPAITLTRLSHLMALAVIALGSSVLGATIGAATVAAAYAAPFAAAWQTWWIAELLGVLVAMPLVLAALPDEESQSKNKLSPARMLEGAGMLLTVAVASQLIFGASPDALPLPYVPLVILMWPAIRFGWRGVALAEFVLTMIAVANTKFGNGPFAESRFLLPQRVFLLQSLLSVSSVSFLALTAIIDERKRVEEKLLAAREEWEQCFNAMPDIVCIVDPAGRIQRCNRAMRQRFEAVHGNVVGLDHAQVFCGAAAPDSKPPWSSVIAGGAPIEIETKLPALPGHYLVAGYPLTHSHGSQWGTVVIVRDITERMKLEEQLRQSQKMDAVGQLAGGVAHDFNNLLTVIIGYVENSLDPAIAVDGNVRYNLSQIRIAADRAAGLTRQLLAFSRHAVLEPQVMDLNVVISESEKMLRRMIGEDVELSVVPDPTISRIKADAGQIGQLLLNLAINARDAMPRGGKLTIATGSIELGDAFAKLQPDAKPGNYVMLSVSDNGCGMTPEIKARIFEPFFTTKGLGSGTGLGLAVVHGIIRQSGGEIEVFSEPGAGSTFKVYFPAVQSEAQAASDRNGSKESRRGSERVLLVEDEDAVRNIAELALRSHGYTVLAAACGKDALRIAEEHEGKFSLLLTDVVMPGMSGRQLSDTLRARHPALKVLFMSGYTTDAAVQYGILEGEANLLQKPFTPSVLAARVREVIDKPAGASHPKIENLTQRR